MSKFLGAWDMDDLCEKSENFLNFCKAVAMKPEEIEYYKKMKETISYSGQGDQWVCEISMGENKSRHEFKLGIKNPPEKGIDGSTFCIEPTLESEDKLVEIATTMLVGHDKEVVTRTERFLTAPNKMKSIVTDVASGVSMTFYATRK
ncbi:uncharacterized protein LOC110450294 [Mizuhopecten yessoensis]|uniref:Uncharacterized protein n=1 Tax=Mizuhopecten yessoensis TaxID=6573 RepID=A0A210QPA2_MIZYE|nr:uncharacterized protein LOC110450294 [Mizuhopecten yessoensis]OWF50567.1 hypothetical protein KP79_PYT18282 [Mizuhopecten yessoensis]